MSSFKITKRVGSSTFEFNETYDDPTELFRKASFITSLPNKCGKCGGDGLSFVERQAETKDGKECAYYYLACQNEKCRWEFKYGQLTKARGGGLYPKGWEAPYTRENDSFYKDLPSGDPGPPPPEMEGSSFREDSLGPNDWRNHPGSEGQRKMIWALAKKAGLDEDALKEYIYTLFGESSYDDGGSVSTKVLTKGMCTDLIDRMKKDYGLGE